MDARMFANGSQMLFGARESRNARNVGSMTCMRPFDGVPRFALLSQLLIARGLNPDSCFMRRISAAMFASEALPVIPSACCATGIHRDAFSAPMASPPASRTLSQEPNSFSATQSFAHPTVFDATFVRMSPIMPPPTALLTEPLILDHRPSNGFQPPLSPLPALPPPPR